MQEESGRINLEEFMLKQLDVTLGMKSRIEAKLATYLAVVSLMLGAILTFISISFSSGFAGDFQKYFAVIAIVFCVGLAEMIICLIPLIPGQVWYFYINELMDAYKSNEIVSDEEILEHNQKLIKYNEGKLERTRFCYLLSYIGLSIFTIGFISISVLFFISMGVNHL